MAVTAPASLSKIKAEFVGPNNLSAYVRGGSYVQNATPNAAVSTTVAGLRISQFTNTYKVTQHSVGKSGDASGTASGTGTFSVTTGSVTVSVSNGVGPFTYAWSHVGGTAATANSSTSATTTFSRSAAAGASYSGTMRCTVTDTGYENRTATVDVTVATTHTSAFSLLSTTPGGFSEAYGVHPGSATAQITIDAHGQIQCSTFGPYNYGTATGTNIAVGKYWKWTYVSGSTPTSGTTTENTWTAVGSGAIYMQRSTAGIRSGEVAISFANDSGGSGATTPGNFSMSAVVEI